MTALKANQNHVVTGERLSTYTPLMLKLRNHDSPNLPFSVSILSLLHAVTVRSFHKIPNT